MMISSLGAYSTPMKLFVYFAIASRSSKSPAFAVYCVLPALMLFMPACEKAVGVEKSGSPTPRDKQSFLVAAIPKNSRMPDGFMSLAIGLSFFE